jgi:flagellin
VDAAIKQVVEQRSDLGAVSNRLEHTVSNLTNVVTNTEMSRSRIQDADYAVETSNMTRGQILQQAGTAMLAQANKMSQSVLALLQ